MSERNDPEIVWRQTSVVIRADILLKAAEMGLDISNECNQALAHLVGIDYQQQQINQTPPKQPIPVLHPVINAEDPTAISKVKTKKQAAVKSIPVAAEIPPGGTTVPLQSPVQALSPAGKGKTGASEKKKKDDTLKKFISTRISRVDAEDAVIPKDDLFQAYTRWCRDHRYAAVPERKAFATLLKNKFALTEKTVNGIPCWMNVILK